MSSKYYYTQRDNQQKLINQGFFNGDPGNGEFRGETYPFILADGRNNLFPDPDAVEQYFEENKISWWSGDAPSGHILSSQIACLNHLFPIMHDHDAVLAMLNGVRDEFDGVLPIPCDAHPQYIAFEVVSDDKNLLNENSNTRGANCTSVDAFILAHHRSGQVWLIPIEWKYTEHYATEDKSAGSSGRTRTDRYNSLIAASRQLHTFLDLKVYYQEPFYQLMRQTLWAERMIENRENETIKADDYFHIHVIPADNDALLRTNPRYPYAISGKSMEATWRDCIDDQSKYAIVTPAGLLAPVLPAFPALKTYLHKRYGE